MLLYSELKRRGVLQAGIAYTVFMWLLIQALYTAHSGNTGEAIILADRALDLSRRRPKALFFAALTYLESGDADTCLELLRETLAKDQSYGQLIASDPDLIAISARERLQSPS